MKDGRDEPEPRRKPSRFALKKANTEISWRRNVRSLKNKKRNKKKLKRNRKVRNIFVNRAV